MDEQGKAEIIRLLLEQAPIDEAKGKQAIMVTTGKDLYALLQGAIKAGYGHLHPAWGIPLYLQRN